VNGVAKIGGRLLTADAALGRQVGLGGGEDYGVNRDRKSVDAVFGPWKCQLNSVTCGYRDDEGEGDEVTDNRTVAESDSQKGTYI